MLNKIRECELKETELFGKNVLAVYNEICNLIDIIYGKNEYDDIDWDFFDIKGTVLLYGIPGGGKTTLIKNCLNRALNLYGTESYYIETSNIIRSNLGESTSRMNRALQEFHEKEEGILFIDEIDKVCVNRKNIDEISELKRMLIELMAGIDRLNMSSKKIIIGCTNVFEQLDEALIRRFTICREIKEPSYEEKVNFFRLCMGKCGKIVGNVQEYNELLKNLKTMDSIKQLFRDSILSKSTNLLEM